ncbi:MAG: hypothetical protein AB7H66_03290 [Hyphomonadaceae bacterium]
MSEFPPAILDDAAIDRMIAAVEEITKEREVALGDDSTERLMIQLAALYAMLWPETKHVSKRSVLTPIQTWRRKWRQNPNQKASENARQKAQSIYAAWRWGGSWHDYKYFVQDDYPRTPQQNRELSPPDIDAFIAHAAQDELAGRPSRRDSYTEILLIVFRRLFGVEPKASLAHERLPDWGGLADSGAAVYFIAQFEREVAARLEPVVGSPFKPRELTHIRDHIAALI